MSWVQKPLIYSGRSKVINSQVLRNLSGREFGFGSPPFQHDLKKRSRDANKSDRHGKNDPHILLHERSKQNKTKLSQLPLKNPKCERRFASFTFQPMTLTPEHWALVTLSASVLRTATPLLLTLAARSYLVKVRINHTQVT